MKNITTLHLLSFTLAGLIATAPLAHAHAVWIEDTPEKQLVIRFGEPGEEYEKSPGYLDNLTLPLAWKAGAEGKAVTFSVDKKPDHFYLNGASSSEQAFAETGFPVFRSEKNPPSKAYYYVRWVPANDGKTVTSPAALLDLVPTAEPGAFNLMFRGAPLPDKKVVVHPQGEKEIELKTDTAGLVRISAAKSGLYVVTASHREPVGGFSLGQAFERTSHIAVVAWRQQ